MFKHPLKDQNVYCIFVPPRRIKLGRNVFAEKKLSSDADDIDFSYVKELLTFFAGKRVAFGK